jgi:CheY-like chemotaxis protein
MDRIIMLHDDLESQMRMYLALCPRYRIEIAENEVALMRLIRRKKPGLLLLDAHHTSLNHDRKSVLKLVDKIKRKHARLRVLAIVNGEDERLVHQLEEQGVDGWVNQPIVDEELLSSVNRLFDPQVVEV